MTTKFELSEVQVKRFETWQKNHQRLDLDPQRPCDVATFSFTETGIGVAVYAKCGCGATYDLSEYELW